MLQSLIDVILPVFLVIGAGYTATRFGYFRETHIDGLMSFTQNFAIPCLLFLAIANLDLGTSFDNDICRILFDVDYVAVPISIGTLITKLGVVGLML